MPHPDVMMMSLTEPETQALGTIEHGLAGSDPRLASMLSIFSRLAAGEEMPADEKIRIRRGRPAAHRPRRAGRHPRRGTAFPLARRPYLRLGRPQAILLLWAVTTAALLTVALLLNTSGHNACIQSIGTECPSPPSHSTALVPDTTSQPAREHLRVGDRLTKGITVEWRDPP